jgi:hypothetical protein
MGLRRLLRGCVSGVVSLRAQPGMAVPLAQQAAPLQWRLAVPLGNGHPQTDDPTGEQQQSEDGHGMPCPYEERATGGWCGALTQAHSQGWLCH